VVYKKDEYEQLIDSSELFSLNRETEHSAYRREVLKMVEYLYCYLMSVNSNKYEAYAVEIVDTAKRCIENYQQKSGRFLNYFNAAWKKEYSHICGNEIIEQKFSGMKLSEQDKRMVKKYMGLLAKMGRFESDEEKYVKIAVLMDKSVEEVKQAALSAEVTVIGGVVYNSEGEEVSVFDNTADEFVIEEYFESLASMIEMLDKIEKVFCGLQDRQKPIVSDMLTTKIGLDIYEIEKLSKEYTFISQGISQQIKRTGIIPTQRDIAEKYGKNEASISRTIKEFLLKVKKGE